jgi:hypothetical protein
MIERPEHHQLDYRVQTRSQVVRAKKTEAKLLHCYAHWLTQQGRKLPAQMYGRLLCDGYEKERNNLIEAKSSVCREHIRMAVGQLLDYAFQGREKFPHPNLAILLPKKPEPTLEKWLQHLNISIIWRDKNSFLDNANGQFS